MKKQGFLFISFLLATWGLMSCTLKRTTDAEIERQQWMESFNDSIEFYQNRSLQIQNELDDINKGIAVLLEKFELVNNPREVTGYYILKGWSDKLPFTTTGIYARISDREDLELIATLAGSTFNKLGIGVGSEEAFTETMPHDQAFNYRHERYNTVYFSGGKADTLALYIAQHHPENLSLNFLEGNTVKNRFIIPSAQKDMITETWQLYSSQKKAHLLQKELWISSRKIDTFRRLLDDGE